MFYSFTQNNSGGFYDYDEKIGISRLVIIESVSINKYSEDFALFRIDKLINKSKYIKSNSCDCCGKRWDLTSFSHFFEDLTSVEVFLIDNSKYWTSIQKEGKFPVFIHYLDGKIEGRPVNSYVPTA